MTWAAATALGVTNQTEFFYQLEGTRKLQREARRTCVDPEQRVPLNKANGFGGVAPAEEICSRMRAVRKSRLLCPRIRELKCFFCLVLR